MSDLIGWSHDDLCGIAVKWLQRASSNRGHGCHVAVSEVKSGWSGEIPDAIGFRQSGMDWTDGSMVVEVKVSRSDFLADRKKAHRQEGGLGNWRYFMCPEGLIHPDEVPQGWGLLWVNKRGHVKPKAGHAHTLANTRHYDVCQQSLANFRHESDTRGEQFILVKLLSRVGDPEAVNRKMREAWSEQGRLANRVNKLADENRELQSQLSNERFGKREMSQRFEEIKQRLCQ